VLCAPPERVYRAFIDPDAMSKWLPPHGFTGRVLEMDARVGGRYRMQFKNLSTDHAHAFGGEYRELVPGQRIVHTDRFDDPSMPGEMLVTIALKEVPSGTEVNIKQEGIPAVIPVDGCYVGWGQSLDLLRQLVEADIRG
jgi:uncharacterized protein YndB with AHSA1/START domain